MRRAPGPSFRLRLALSYAGFLMVAGALLLAVVWVFLLRYVPADTLPTSAPFQPNRGDLVRAFMPPASWALFFLLVLGLVAGWVLAGRMLAPLTRITDAARQAGAGSLSHRIALPGRSDELRELADSFDAMLARLESQVEEQRRFAANASHELRTPLAISQTLLEVARADPDRDADLLIERLGAVNRRAIELTEALLMLSRAEQRSFATDPVDLSLLVEESAEALLPLAEAKGVSIVVDGDVSVTNGSPALLLQLTTNLLHNAILHNIAAGESRVWVTTAAGPDFCALTVENTGEVLPTQLVATLTEPFLRGTQRIHGDQAGVGLGLAIARSITEAHGGTLALVPRAGGGLRVTATLPGVVRRREEEA